VTWVAPSDGGSAITGYKARLYRNGNEVAANDGLSANATSHTFNNVQAGSYTIRVIATNSQGDSPLSPASVQISVGSALLTQTITFPQPAAQAFPGTLTLNAIADSGLSVTLTAAGSCTVDSAAQIVTFTSVGLCEITASQAGNGSYDVAPTVSRSFSIQQQSSSVGGAGVGGSAAALRVSISSISQEFLPSTNTLRLRFQGEYLDLVTALFIASSSAIITSQTPGLLIASIPVPPIGNYDVFVTYGNQQIYLPNVLKVTVDYLKPQPSISPTVSDSDSVSPEALSSRITIGTFKGFVAIYFKGFQGELAALKLAGKWVLVPKVNSDFYRLVRKTGAGYLVKAEVFINKKLVVQKTLKTR
jgi:hypothetical protein